MLLHQHGFKLLPAYFGPTVNYDPDAIIRFAHLNEDYKIRLEPDKILEAVKAN